MLHAPHQTEVECTKMGLMCLCLFVSKWVLEPDGDKETRSVDTDLNGMHSDRAKNKVYTETYKHNVCVRFFSMPVEATASILSFETEIRH